MQGTVSMQCPARLTFIADTAAPLITGLGK